jgi:ABC-type multidrug transport system ATPase subunit
VNERKTDVGVRKRAAGEPKPEAGQRKKRRRRKPKVVGALQATGVSKSYGDLVALAPLDISVADGERVALVGHNGSGKSTLLRLAVGLLDPSSGEVAVHGAAAGTAPARAATAYVPDDPVLYDDLSVDEHLAYTAGLHGAELPDELVEQLLGSLGLTDRRDDLPVRFSRGLRQKTSIALALVRPFDVLLVDEPFVGLDAPGREGLLGLLAEVHAEGRTTIVATHDPSYVERADRCVALRDGRIVHDGPASPAEVLDLVSS